MKKKFSKSFQIETHYHQTRLNPVFIIILFTIPRHEDKNEGKNGHLKKENGKGAKIMFWLYIWM